MRDINSYKTEAGETQINEAALQDLSDALERDSRRYPQPLDTYAE